MNRLALMLVVGLLAVSGSGVIDLLAAEPCSITESSSTQDGCAATCVRCHCTRAVEPAVHLAMSDAPPLSAEWLPFTLPVPLPIPHDILHVPKAA